MSKFNRLGKLSSEHGKLKESPAAGPRTRTEPSTADKCKDVHPPESMMHSHPVSYLPRFLNIFHTPLKIFPISPFPNKIFDFHLPKLLMTFFLVIHSKFSLIPSLFSRF